MGTRLREASEKLPKPLVDIGGMPVLWHIMKLYGSHGFRRFVLCLGYKGDAIKRYFLEHRFLNSDFTLHMRDDRRELIVEHRSEDWEVCFAETGLLTGTGARVRRVLPYLGTAPTFALTYGDGIGDIDLTALLASHEDSGLTGTVTGVHPTSRFGEMRVTGDKDLVDEFNEKPTRPDGWVSGGFFMLERHFVTEYLDDDPGLLLEQAPLQRLAADGRLGVHRHEGFWMGMDTYRDWLELNARWDAGDAPWWPASASLEVPVMRSER
jgi:glucose-1-phosphate cytidylyltransferase